MNEVPWSLQSSSADTQGADEWIRHNIACLARKLEQRIAEPDKSRVSEVRAFLEYLRPFIRATAVLTIDQQHAIGREIMRIARMEDGHQRRMEAFAVIAIINGY